MFVTTLLPTPKSRAAKTVLPDGIDARVVQAAVATTPAWLRLTPNVLPDANSYTIQAIG